MTKLQLIEGSNAKLHVTTEFSSSNYPKIIYGEPLFEKLVKFRFEFEFKFEFELKTEKELKRKKEIKKKKKKKKKKRKKKQEKGASHTGWLRPKRPSLTASL